MPSTTDLTPEIVDITIGKYRVQLQSLNGQPDRWLQVHMPDLDATDDRTIPAVFTDVTEGEMFLNHMRDMNPRCVYRMVRDVTITEVVHA